MRPMKVNKDSLIRKLEGVVDLGFMFLTLL